MNQQRPDYPAALHYPAPAPQSGPYGASYSAQAAPTTNGMATGGMVVGIVSLASAFLFMFTPILISPVGIILSIVGLRQSRQNPGQIGRASAIAGIVTSVLALVVAAMFILFFGAAIWFLVTAANCDPALGDCWYTTTTLR